MSEFVDWSAARTADAVRKGEVQAREVCEAFLQRAKATQAHTRAWRRFDEQGARASAAAVDASLCAAIAVRVVLAPAHRSTRF